MARAAGLRLLPPDAGDPLALHAVDLAWSKRGLRSMSPAAPPDGSRFFFSADRGGAIAVQAGAGADLRPALLRCARRRRARRGRPRLHRAGWRWGWRCRLPAGSAEQPPANSRSICTTGDVVALGQDHRGAVGQGGALLGGNPSGQGKLAGIGTPALWSTAPSCGLVLRIRRAARTAPGCPPGLPAGPVRTGFTVNTWLGLFNQPRRRRAHLRRVALGDRLQRLAEAARVVRRSRRRPARRPCRRNRRCA